MEQAPVAEAVVVRSVSEEDTMGTPSRMLKLLSLLQTRRDWPGRVLADRLEVSPRTLRRDVDQLRDMGYRIRAIKGPDGGYRLEAGSELPPLLFDDDQAVAVAVALRVAPASGVDLEEAASRALSTVRQVMPPRLRSRIDGVTVTAARPPDASATLVDPDVLLAVSGAVNACEELRFDYRPAGETGSEVGPPRRVQPHHVVASGGRWYLVAWDLDRDDWRVFRLDRMTPRIPLGPRFTRREVPGGDVGTFLMARFKGAEGVDAWPCMGEVVLGLPARQVAPFISDGVVEDLGADHCRLVAGSWSWVALAASFGRFDAEITAVKPPELVDAFALLADRYGAVAT